MRYKNYCESKVIYQRRWGCNSDYSWMEDGGYVIIQLFYQVARYTLLNKNGEKKTMRRQKSTNILKVLIFIILLCGCNKSDDVIVNQYFKITYEQYTDIKMLLYEYYDYTDIPIQYKEYLHNRITKYLTSEDEQRNEFERLKIVYSEVERLGLTMNQTLVDQHGSFFLQQILLTEDEGFTEQVELLEDKYGITEEELAQKVAAPVGVLDILYQEYFIYYAENVANIDIMTSDELNTLSGLIGEEEANKEYFDILIPALQSYDEYLNNLVQAAGL